MSKPEKDEDGNTAAHYVAYGFMWLLILIGFGACTNLAHRSDDKPIISIQTSK